MLVSGLRVVGLAGRARRTCAGIVRRGQRTRRRRRRLRDASRACPRSGRCGGGRCGGGRRGCGRRGRRSGRCSRSRRRSRGLRPRGRGEPSEHERRSDEQREPAPQSEGARDDERGAGADPLDAKTSAGDRLGGASGSGLDHDRGRLTYGFRVHCKRGRGSGQVVSREMRRRPVAQAAGGLKTVAQDPRGIVRGSRSRTRLHFTGALDRRAARCL